MGKKFVCVYGVLLATFLGNLFGNESKSNLFGFHSEIVRANTYNLIGINVATQPHGRLVRTIGQAFGLENAAGLKSPTFGFDSNNPTEADIIWIWRDDGSWLGIYYNDQDLTTEIPPMTRGWKAIGFGDTDASRVAIPENGGFFLQSRQERDWLLVFGGNVNASPKFLNIKNGYNIVNRGTPWPLRLDECDIENSHSFRKGVNGDSIGFDNSDGKWEQYYFDGEWKKTNSPDGDYGHVELPSAFFVYRRGKQGYIWIQPPVGVSPTKNKLSNTPPAPDVSARLGLNGWGNPIFEISWPSNSPKIVYRSEVFGSRPDLPPEEAGDRSGWFYLPPRRGTFGETLSDHALLRWLRYGIVRVSAKWEYDHLAQEKAQIE